MTTNRRAVAALTAAGLAWGTTVPLSKLALAWLAPGWLTFTRFGLAAAVLLAAASRSGLRAACTPAVLASGAIGYGGSVLVQNAGIARTSVTHAALLIGATPVLIAIIAALWHRTVARPVAWAGFTVSLAGIGLITVGRGGGATAGGDGLVLAALLLSAAFTVAQARVLAGRDPVAVTAVQFLGAAVAVLPFSVTAEGMPSAPHGPGTVLAAAALALGGTLLPFTLFAYGQSRISAEVAGAFLNLEPLVGAVTGAIAFGNPVGTAQVTGGAAIIAGIALSSLPLLAGHRRRPRVPGASPAASPPRPAPAGGKSRPAAQAPGRPIPTSAVRCPDRRPPVSGSRQHPARRGTCRPDHPPGRRKIAGHGSLTTTRRYLDPGDRHRQARGPCSASGLPSIRRVCRILAASDGPKALRARRVLMALVQPGSAHVVPVRTSAAAGS
jgi:drug/metabolite transporter (DMT)-like permease